MASEIRVNRLSNRSGLSTITFANGGVQFSGITTFANGDFRVGTGATILNPSTNEMQFHTGGSSRLTINNSGATIAALTATTGTFSSDVSIGGVLTYEDVKNVDAIGIVTARTGVKVTGGDFTVGTAITASSVTGNVTNDVGITTYSGSAVWFKGATTNKDMYWSHASGATVYKDNAQILMGNSSDLQIYHDSSSSENRIQISNGNLFIDAVTQNEMMFTHDSKYMIRMTPDAQVRLYHDGDVKFATTTSGIDVTGVVVADDLIVTGTSVVGDFKSTNNNYVLGIAGNNSSVKAYFGTDSSGNFLLATGSGVAERLRITSDGKVGIGIDPTAKLHVNGVSTSDIITARAADTNGASVINILAEGTTGISRINFSDTAGTDAWISYYHSHRAFAFTTAGTANERLRIKSTGEVRIGANNTTASTAGDDLVIEGSSDRGLSIISGTSSSANIYFGDSSDTDIGRIAYQHNDNTLDFSVNAASPMLRMQSDGNMRWYPDGGSTGVNFYMSSNGASGIIFAANKDGSTGTSLHFKNQNSSGQAQTWMEVNDSQRISIPYGMGGTDKLNIYVAADVTKGINIMGQDGNNQNSDSGRIHFNGYAQTNGPWIGGDNVQSWGKKDLVFGTVSTTNDYTTEVGETMRMLYYGSMQGGISPDATLWDSGNQMGWHYNRSAGSFQQATNASTGYASWYINKNTGNGGGTQDRRYFDFYWNSSQYGRIEYNNASGVNYNTSSDYRLKENNVLITDGIAKVKQLKPYRFNFKTDDDSKVVQGFFAHEAQEIVPYAVSGTKDGTKTDERGDSVPDYQQVDYAKFTPILTAALKEAIAEIETLKAKVAALEGS